MSAIRLPETLVILEAKKLIGELFQAAFTEFNDFSGVCVAKDWPSPLFSSKIEGPVVFLVIVHSYRQACQTIPKISISHPEATIVVLDGQLRSGCGLLVRNTIVHGYWTFHDTVKEITDGLIRASRRFPSLSPHAREYLRHSPRKGVQIVPGLLEHPVYKLSKREWQLFELFASGKKNEACAAEMGIAPKTACHLREKLMKKFNVKSGTDLIWKAIEIGWILPADA